MMTLMKNPVGECEKKNINFVSINKKLIRPYLLITKFILSLLFKIMLKYGTI